MVVLVSLPRRAETVVPLAERIARLTNVESEQLEALRAALPRRPYESRASLRRRIAEIRELRIQLNALWRQRFEYSEELAKGREAIEIVSPCNPEYSFMYGPPPGTDSTWRRETARAYSFVSRDRKHHWRIAYAPQADRYFAASLCVRPEGPWQSAEEWVGWFDRNARAAAEGLQKRPA
jgi:hypothetical protein